MSGGTSGLGSGDDQAPQNYQETGMSSSTSYDPSAVQKEIEEFFRDHHGPLTEYENVFMMYLMQEFGVQVTGLDANLQGEMNKYFTDIQNAQNILYAADNKGASAADYGEVGGKTLDQQFHDALAAINTQLHKDTFFDGSPSRSAMRNSIESTISGILSGTGTDNPTSSSTSLYDMWSVYDPGLTGSSTTSTAQGDPTAMDNLMRQLGQLNQQVTGVSQVVGAKTKADMKVLQTEMTTMVNWVKTLHKCVGYISQQSRTS